MHVEELHRAAERRVVGELAHAGNGAAWRGPSCTTAEAPRGPTLGLAAPPSCSQRRLGVRDEALGVGARDHDRADALVGLGAGDERCEVGGDLGSELAARAAVESGEEHASSLLDLDPEAVALARGHARPFVRDMAASSVSG